MPTGVTYVTEKHSFLVKGVPSSHPRHFVVFFFLNHRFRLRLGTDKGWGVFVLFLSGI